MGRWTPQRESSIREASEAQSLSSVSGYSRVSGAQPAKRPVTANSIRRLRVRPAALSLGRSGRRSPSRSMTLGRRQCPRPRSADGGLGASGRESEVVVGAADVVGVSEIGSVREQATHGELDAPIQRPTDRSVIGGDGVIFAMADGGDPAGIDAISNDPVHGDLGSSLGQ